MQPNRKRNQTFAQKTHENLLSRVDKRHGLINNRTPLSEERFLDSSMVEQPAVNRQVVGSSPTRGAKKNQWRKNHCLRLTETPSHKNGWAFSYPTVIKHLRRFCHPSANSPQFYSGDDFSTQPQRIANMYRQIRKKLSKHLCQASSKILSPESDRLTTGKNRLPASFPLVWLTQSPLR